MNPRPPIPETIVEQAVAWYVQVEAGASSDRDREALARWLAAHPQHLHAWERLQGMKARLQGSSAHVAPAVTHSTMTRLAALAGRRQALKTLAWAGAGGAGLYLVQSRVPWRRELAAALADVRTATGERRDMTLADGTRLRLNTGTAIDLRLDGPERRIVLRGGEIMVATAKDRAGRPFFVETADGVLMPVGTRFTVRHDDEQAARPGTRLAVTEGAVEARAAAGPQGAATLVRAGQQLHFARGRIGAPEPLDETSQTWLDGTLSAENMRLADFLAELGRYRRGEVRCAAEVADLRVTGAWPLNVPDATERVLDSLERHFPVRVNRYTRYWVSVAAR